MLKRWLSDILPVPGHSSRFPEQKGRLDWEVWLPPMVPKALSNSNTTPKGPWGSSHRSLSYTVLTEAWELSVKLIAPLVVDPVGSGRLHTSPEYSERFCPCYERH